MVYGPNFMAHRVLKEGRLMAPEELRTSHDKGVLSLSLPGQNLRVTAQLSALLRLNLGRVLLLFVFWLSVVTLRFGFLQLL